MGICYYFLLPSLNWFIGYHGYEKEKIRKNTWGDIRESKYRDAFQKKLKFISYINCDTIHSDSINIYIEKGYKYGYFSYDKTNFELGKTKYPFQISHTERTNHNLVTYSFIESQKFDSIGDYNIVYLKESKIKDTLKMKVECWNLVKGKTVWDSIGFIKVFE